MILLLLGLIISGILGYLIMNKINIKKIMSQHKEEGMSGNLKALEHKEASYVQQAIA